MDVLLRLNVTPKLGTVAIKDSFTWLVDESKTLQVTLGPNPEKKREPNLRVTGKFSIPADVLTDLEELSAGIMPKRCPVKPEDALGVEPDGRLKDKHMLYFEYLHEETSEWWMSHTRRFRQLSNDFAHAFIFRHGLDAPTNPVGHARLTWSKDGEVWNDGPTDVKLQLKFKKVREPNAETIQDIVEIAESGTSEPLPNELLREADSLGAFPRSRLIIMVSALEIAVKRCISTLAPDASWLCENMASPDVLKLIWNYLPSLKALPNMVGPLIPPKGLRKDIQTAIETRNKLVHGGRMESRHTECLRSQDELAKQLRDVVWTLELNNGFDWPQEHLQPETRKLISEDVAKAHKAREIVAPNITKEQTPIGGE
ncbi:MAG: hypothetical protein H7Y17_06000 [Chlorobia bacterium]|nr:hypothetical protein [Fimbriimonadaceae bacterium]